MDKNQPDSRWLKVGQLKEALAAYDDNGYVLVEIPEHLESAPFTYMQHTEIAEHQAKLFLMLRLFEFNHRNEA